jgi:hypothetical protein
VKTHGQCLTEITARLAAENAILRMDNAELRAQIGKQKERVKGKRFQLKGCHAISTEAMHQAIADSQKTTQKRTIKWKPQQSKRVQDSSSSDEKEEANTDSEVEEDGIEIGDCIVVKVT